MFTCLLASAIWAACGYSPTPVNGRRTHSFPAVWWLQGDVMLWWAMVGGNLEALGLIRSREENSVCGLDRDELSRLRLGAMLSRCVRVVHSTGCAYS